MAARHAAGRAGSSKCPVTGRSGYLRWRSALHEQHASDVAAIVRGVGYDHATIARVQDLVRMRGLGTDPEVQVLEDALCLVFIETQLRALATRLGASERSLLEAPLGE